MGVEEPSKTPSWWDILEYRRQYVSDRTWIGFGLIIIGLAGASLHPWALLALALVGIGLLLIVSGVRRALSKTDPVTGESRPTRPW